MFIVKMGINFSQANKSAKVTLIGYVASVAAQKTHGQIKNPVLPLSSQIIEGLANFFAAPDPRNSKNWKLFICQ